MSIVALAGRRPDPIGARTARFPSKSQDQVVNRISAMFDTEGVSDLVCSAAAGADLLALAVAEHKTIRSHIILPYDQSSFRANSVADRPGKWGVLFDDAVKLASQLGTLTIMPLNQTDEDAFVKVNEHILIRAQELAIQSQDPSVIAVVVWEGTGRGDRDVTADFLNRARHKGISVQEIRTL